MLNWKSRLHNYLSKRHQFSQNNHSISDKFDTNHFLYIKKNDPLKIRGILKLKLKFYEIGKKKGSRLKI